MNTTLDAINDSINKIIEQKKLYILESQNYKFFFKFHSFFLILFNGILQLGLLLQQRKLNSTINPNFYYFLISYQCLLFISCFCFEKLIASERNRYFSRNILNLLLIEYAFQLIQIDPQNSYLLVFIIYFIKSVKDVTHAFYQISQLVIVIIYLGIRVYFFYTNNMSSLFTLIVSTIMSFFLSIQPFTSEQRQNLLQDSNIQSQIHSNYEKNNQQQQQQQLNITFAKKFKQVDQQSQIQSRLNSDNQISFQKIYYGQSKNNLSYCQSQFSSAKQNQKFLNGMSNFLEQIDSQGNDGSSVDQASQSIKKQKSQKAKNDLPISQQSQQIGLNILNSINTGIVLIDSKNNLVYSNSYFKQFFGQNSQNNAYKQFLSLFIKENQKLKASIKRLKISNQINDNQLSSNSSFSEIKINNSVYKNDLANSKNLEDSGINQKETKGSPTIMTRRKYQNRKSDSFIVYNQNDDLSNNLNNKETKNNANQKQDNKTKKQFYSKSKQNNLKLKKSNSSINITSKGQIKYQKEKHSELQELKYAFKQQVIPIDVLDIFKKDEVVVLDLVKKILSAKFKNKKNVFYSAVNLDENQEEQQSESKFDKSQAKQNFKGISNKGKIDQDDNNINYYIERNNLIINFSQKGDFFQYLQMKIGVYQNEIDIQSYNSFQQDDLKEQIFILVEISDQSQIQINVQEREISEYKNRMLSSVTHELRTPLNCSIQMLELMNLKFDDEQINIEKINLIQEAREELLKPALLSNYLLLNMINDILDYGQINSGYFQLAFKPFPILDLMTECAEMISFQASLKGIIVELNLDPALPQIINSDQNRIKQVLLNLLNNSLKFTEEGYIEINVAKDQAELIRIDVCDTGVGIPKDNLNKIFDCFGDKSKQNILNTRGAGLGLSIANSLAMGLSGNRKIKVISKENQGTVFSFYIINRQLNKKGCQFKLKDMFNKKLIRWESMNNNNTDYHQPSISSQVKAQKALKRLQTNDSITSYSKNSIKNLDPYLCELSSQQNENISYNDSLSVKTFQVANNLITFTIRPSSKYQEGSINTTKNRSKSTSVNLTISSYVRKQLGPKRVSTVGDQNFSQNSFGDEKQISEKQSKHDYKTYGIKFNRNQTIQSNGLERYDSSQILEDNSKEAFYLPNESYIKGSIKGHHILNFLNYKSDLYQQMQSPHNDIYPQIQIDKYESQGDSKNTLKKKLTLSSLGSSKVGTIDNRQIYNSNLTPVDSFLNFQPDFKKETVLKLLIEYNKKQQCNCSQILIVDDNDFNLYVLFLRLQTYGFKIEKATSGVIAIQKVKLKYNSQDCCKKYKLIFMDIDMPVKDGHQTSLEINQFFKNNNIQPSPISAYTAYVQQKEMNKAFESGMQYYITKPINQKDLEEVLIKVFQKLL